jgi:hypothetical protein
MDGYPNAIQNAGIETALIVILAKAGIQVRSNSWIPGRASYRPLARNDN